MAIARGLLVTIMSCEAGARRTSTAAIVLLGLAVGMAAAYPRAPPGPAGGGSNATLLGRRWERLFSRSSSVTTGLRSGERAEQQRWESDYLLGIKRVRRLYCNVGIGYHLQVLSDGTVNGVHHENLRSLIEISTVDRGVVSLLGVHSGRFVAMNSRGRLYGATVFHRECMFRESLLPNNYNAYESVPHAASFIALTRHGRARRGDRATTAMTVTHFLPRM